MKILDIKEQNSIINIRKKIYYNFLDKDYLINVQQILENNAGMCYWYRYNITKNQLESSIEYNYNEDDIIDVNIFITTNYMKLTRRKIKTTWRENGFISFLYNPKLRVKMLVKIKEI